MSVSKVSISTAAVREILRSDGVKAILREECEEAAERCNRLVEWHSPMEAESFGGDVQDGGFTAVGIVGMRHLGPREDGRLAVAHYDAKHKVLLKGTGW